MTPALEFNKVKLTGHTAADHAGSAKAPSANAATQASARGFRRRRFEPVPAAALPPPADAANSDATCTARRARFQTRL
jgi:hypothetical protein